MGVVYCQQAAWMNWVLWGETANQVLSPPSKPTPLAVQNPKRTNLQGEWQGKQAFPLRHREGNRGSNQGREEGGWWLSVNQKKKKSGKHGRVRKKGGERDGPKNMNKTSTGQTENKLIRMPSKIPQRDVTLSETSTIPLKCSVYRLKNPPPPRLPFIPCWVISSQLKSHLVTKRIVTGGGWGTPPLLLLSCICHLAVFQ